MNKSRVLPFLPIRLGILTSAGGTVINDFLASLEEARFGFQLYWCPTTVQGSEARNDLLQGLRCLTGAGVDAILVFRGGGSAAELSLFNDYELAKAVCLCPIPVVAAIGHQEDQSSVQDVSFLALGVPKDVGRYFASFIERYRQGLTAMAANITAFTSPNVALYEHRVSAHAALLASRAMHLLASSSESLRRASETLPHLAAAISNYAGHRFAAVAGPLKHLGAGTERARSEKLAAVAGRIFAASGFVRDGMELRLTGAGGRVLASGEQLLDRVFRSFQHLLVQKRTAMERSLERVEAALTQLEIVISEGDPEKQLQRGYCIVRRPASQAVITESAGLSAADDVELQFRDARRNARIS